MLEVIDVWKSYEGKPLLNGLSFQVARSETVCLLGASGSGKSTLLRIIAGLETSERGQIRWDGDDLVNVPIHQRHFGLVFQDYALFPHLNAFENVAFGLRMAKLSAAEVSLRVGEVLEKVSMTGFETRKVTDLSGGEQQRVALARALVPRPRLLMFDEPLGALDRSLRESLMLELRSLLKAADVPAIYVTHDQEEAFTVADRILMLHEGVFRRSGSPAEIWADPGSAWAARFLAMGNIIEGTVTGSDSHPRAQTAWGILDLPCSHSHQAGDRVDLLVRPQGAALSPQGQVRGRVSDVLFQHDHYKVSLADGLFFYIPEPLQVGQEIILKVTGSEVQCLS